MTGPTIRPETVADEAFLRRLTVAGRWAEFAALPLSDEHKRAMLGQQHDAQRQHYRTYYAGAAFSVIELDGVAIGRLCLLRGERDDTLVDIAVLPDHRGTGIGGMVLDRILEEAAALGRGVTLRVDHANPARRLYERKGFRETARGDVDAEMTWRARA